MCGIVAYLGKDNAVPFLVGGLKRLEYRGYDSVGISFIQKNTGQIKTVKQSGSIEDLKVSKKFNGHIGIGHTRWATHGKACKRNAHPHVTYNNSLALVHNGIIENYKEIKNSFRDKYTINSDTDSEILLYLIYDVLQEVGDLYSAVKIATEKVIGAYAFILLDQQHPDTLICAKNGSSLCVGVDEGNYYVASDISAFNKNTNNFRFDASLEEVLHLITHEGYAKVYPKIFGESKGSEVAKAMDNARGGYFITVPSKYPTGAWYSYDDKTCDYSCMITEYTYWSLTSILGAQAYPGRFEEIKHEWKLNTLEKVKNGDPSIYSILTNFDYKLPTKLPDNNYNGFIISLNSKK